MKRSARISMMVSIAALALAAPSFAFGGGTGGSHQMSSSMHQGQGYTMQNGSANGAGIQHGTIKSTVSPSTMQGGPASTTSKPYGKMNVSGNGMTTKEPPATPTTN